MLVTQICIYDDREFVRTMQPIYSPLTEFLLKGQLPRGFINELLNRTVVNPGHIEKVSKQYFG